MLRYTVGEASDIPKANQKGIDDIYHSLFMQLIRRLAVKRAWPKMDTEDFQTMLDVLRNRTLNKKG